MMDFTHTVFADGYQIYVPVDGNHGLNLWMLIQESSLLQVLGLTVAGLLVVAHILWLLERRKAESSFRKEYIGGIEDAFWWTIVTITTVGYGDKIPVSRSGRIIAMLLMLLSLFLVSLFVGEITTALTVSRLESIIEGPSDLPGHTVGVLNGTVFDDYVTDTGLEAVRFDTADALFQALVDGEVDAIVHARAAGLLLKGQLASQIRMIGPPFQSDHIALGLPQGSPLREAINRALFSLRERGVYDQIYDRWFGQNQ